MVDVFPEWKPNKSTIRKIKSFNERERYKALRNSCSTFTRRADVRRYIFSRDGFCCQKCGSGDSLTIDHINSVYKAATGKYDYMKLNTNENLVTLCNLCNGGKLP